MATSRETPERNAYVFPEMSRKHNLKFLQYDCTKKLTVPDKSLEDCAAVLHMIGTLRVNHLYTRMFAEVADTYMDYQRRRSRRSSNNNNKKANQIEAILSIFALSSHYYQ